MYLSFVFVNLMHTLVHCREFNRQVEALRYTWLTFLFYFIASSFFVVVVFQIRFTSPILFLRMHYYSEENLRMEVEIGLVSSATIHLQASTNLNIFQTHAHMHWSILVASIKRVSLNGK